jgi:hypothetical protein
MLQTEREQFMLYEDSKELQTSEEPKMGRRRLLRRGGFFAGLTAVATTFSLTPFTPVHANVVDGLKVEELKGIEAEGYIREAIDSSNYRLFRQRVNQEQKETLSILEHAAVALTISSSQGSTVIVRIPIKGGLGYSAYGVEFQNGQVLQSQGALFTYTQEHDVHIEMERNGQAILNAVVKQDGHIVQGTMRISNGSEISLQGFTTKQTIPYANPANPFQTICCIVGGLERLAGISIIVGDLIAAACIAACAATAGVACAACLLGVVTVGGGLVGTIIGRCNYNVNTYGTCR